MLMPRRSLLAVVALAAASLAAPAHERFAGSDT
jgi:hypothetical protein